MRALRYTGPIEALFLIHDVTLAEAFSDETHARFRSGPMTIVIEVVREVTEERVRREREVRGPLPIGCALRSEEACLEALRGGADEALVLTLPEPPRIHGLIDRTLLRASLRRHHERLSASIGHAEKLTALGTLVSGVAHEINNPLAAVALSVNSLELAIDPLIASRDELMRLAFLGRPVEPEELRRIARSVRDAAPPWDVPSALEDITLSVNAITDVVRDLRVFARVDEEEQSQVVDVVDLVEQVLRIVRREIERHAVLERDFPKDLPRLYAPRTRLAQVLTNVLINAAHAVRDVERPVHRVRISARADDEMVAVVVGDTGPGIAPADIERIFDPFYTTKRQDMGTGLGLSISRSILRRLGGDLVVDSVHGDGAKFVLMIPLPDPAHAHLTREVGRKPERPSRDRLAVLVVDDDQAMIRAYSRSLSTHHDVIIASDAEEAVELLASGTEADVVISELSMPGMSGPELYAWFKRERPRLAARTLFVTADYVPTPDTEELEREGVAVLTKPLGRDVLLNAIRAISEY